MHSSIVQATAGLTVSATEFPLACLAELLGSFQCHNLVRMVQYPVKMPLYAFVCLCMPLRFSGNVHNGPKKLGLVFKRDSQQDVRVFKLQNQNRYDDMSVLTPDSLWDSGCAGMPGQDS